MPFSSTTEMASSVEAIIASNNPWMCLRFVISSAKHITSVMSRKTDTAPIMTPPLSLTGILLQIIVTSPRTCFWFSSSCPVFSTICSLVLGMTSSAALPIMSSGSTFINLPAAALNTVMMPEESTATIPS